MSEKTIAFFNVITSQLERNDLVEWQKKIKRKQGNKNIPF
jgi:hypothetical protein